MSGTVKQIKDYPISDTAIMRHPEFRQGVEDFRTRKRPDFDFDRHSGRYRDGDGWYYERGRQFAALAPRDLPITSREARKIFKSEDIR